ncbi:uncharacterized protein RJT20DRAFT_133105 [Scheffersomyces xylosifermentans]|uniref:uncharacterized protein n=1 Tax=Scheffersomyces xylosifermentans TaxID=1304137 RepID=UPI00315DCEF4
MKLIRILVAALPLVTPVVVASGFGDSAAAAAAAELYEERADALEELLDNFLLQHEAVLSKRDTTSDTVASILREVGDSGIITKVLNQIAGSPQAVDNLANLTVTLVENGGGVISGVNITSLNITSIVNSVLNSGIVTQVLDGLLLNETNRVQLATVVGHILGSPNNTFIPQLLIELGAGKKLTVPFLADLIQNTKSKTDEIVMKNAIVFGNVKRDDDQYAGSANSFFNNLINHVIGSQLVSGSLDDILIGLNQSEITVPLVMEILQDAPVRGMAASLIGKLYSAGLFDNIDLNGPYTKLKKENVLSNVIEVAMTDPTYSPALGLVFKQMEDNGVYQQIQYNLYGKK